MNQNDSWFTRIKTFLKAPVFKDDEEKTRLAGLLNIVIWFYLGLLLVVALAMPLFQNGNMLLGVGVIAAMMVPVIASAVLLRKGYVQMAGWIFTICILLVTLGLLPISGGVESPVMNNVLSLLIIVGLVLGGQATIGISLLSLVAVFCIAFFESRGMLPPASIGPNSTTALFTTVFNFSLASAMLYLASDGIGRALRRARNNEQVLAERNEQLQTTVEKYVDFMARVAQGDLASRIPIDGNGHEPKDPLIVLGQRLNETTASLQGMILQTREAAKDLSSAATEILAATTQQLSSSSEQSASISQTTTTVDEVKTIAEQAVTRAQEVSESSIRTREVSKTGNQSVQETVASMDHIKQRVESIAENILALTEQTQQIGEIISTVSDIAAQSNMLSLNASVEAARAGEHGKGFAVVAAEVRSLATQSKQAAAQVRAILSEIQDATNAAVMATEEGTKQVEEGVQLASRTGAAIEQLWQVIDESAQTAMQMVAGGRQQASGMEQIAQAMTAINQATVQSLSSTRQAEMTAQNLTRLATRLTATVEQYQL